MRTHGEARVRLYEKRHLDALKKDWSLDEKIAHVCSHDTDWSKNVVTDYGRRFIIVNFWGGTIDVFIHQSTNPGDVRANSLQNLYASQVPSQSNDNPTPVNDLGLLLQTRTVQFTPPSVQRNINIVGLSAGGIQDGSLYGILAYTKLSSVVVQGTTQTADVQYRVTFSLD